jgi:PAS domain S-box-containing protein
MTTLLRSQQELAASAESVVDRFAMLVDSVDEYAIFLLDVDGRVASWNAGAERIKGYRADEVLGKNCSIFYLEEDTAAGKPARDLAIAARDGRHSEEAPRVRKDGTRFYANVTLTALRDEHGRLQGFGKVTQDVTQLRQTLAALRQSEERMRLMVDAVREYAIFMLDPRGQIMTWNAGAERIKGYRSDEVIGRHFSLFYTQEDRERGHPENELVLARERGSYGEEGWRLRKDGTRFWASVLITALEENGTHVGFAKVTRDMTERRIAEEKLRDLNEDLERRVQQRTADLVMANRELEAFSYSVSHDLRAPLRALDGFSRLLLDMTAGKLNDKEQDYLRRIRNAAQRMAQLTDAMLMLARLTRAPIDPRPMDLSQLASSVANDLRQGAPERSVEVVVEPGMQACVDARLARALFENLLRNAWKFTRDATKPRIEVGASQADGETIFFVRDNGVGFDPAFKSKLFVPFQRLHRAKDFEGSGIGLATVSRIVQRHGGRIWADSALGQGATFYFSFERAHGSA